jgi:pseudouridine-5'-phosphate glycosidase
MRNNTTNYDAARQRWLSLAPEVTEALGAGRPVVALESTVISHGMPYPENLETAYGLEAAVREQGAVPATIAILDGRIRVGLSPAEIERLGTGHEPVTKLSRRDVAVQIARGGLGATTVAATMIAARLAGIAVFATGGIGGVHREAQRTFDLSADLSELARTDVAVVCSGAKSILDLGLTLEVLETLGVTVLGYGTDRFPAFYTRSSGHGVDSRVDSPQEVARICAARWGLGLGGGILVANPVPAEHALPPEIIDGAISAALADAADQGISGKAVTPFLLARVNERTEGAALRANIALLRSNAKVAGQIACALVAEQR